MPSGQSLFCSGKVTGLSARIASLALSIGLISSLKRCDEGNVPSWPFAFTKTAARPATVDPPDTSDKVFVWVLRANADGFRLGKITQIANVDVLVAGREIIAGYIAQCDVVVAAGVPNQRSNADGSVVYAGGVAMSAIKPVAVLLLPWCCQKAPNITSGRVVAPQWLLN